MSMRKSRKLISLAIAVVFLLSAMVPAAAFAAGHADDQADAGARLKALGIIEGYPDGSLGLDRNITRAEMTVVLSEMSGMSNAASVLQNVPSGFSDVATGVWYTGYVNLASNQGWVAGYPDGTFKPNAQVTYAEAITMMLNALGYSKGELPGSWPSNYLIKAAELGITDGVSFASNAPAVRGDVFIIAIDTLGQDIVNWDRNESAFVPTGDTLLDKLGLTLVEDVILADAYLLIGSDLDRDDRVVEDVDGGLHEVAEGFDIRPYIGVESDFYFNSDDKIVAVKSSAAVMTAEIDKIEADGRIVFKGSSTKNAVSDDVVVIVNEEADGTIPTSGFVRYSRAGGEITLIDAVVYDDMDAVRIVKSIEINDDDELVLKSHDGFPDVVIDDISDAYVLLFGVDSIDDIEEWDVIYWNADPDDYGFWVISEKVSGNATSYSNANRWITIGGVRYDVTDPAYGSTDNGKNFSEITNLETFSGESVLALLDGYGDVIGLAADTDAVVDQVAVMLTGIQAQSSFGTWQYRVKLLLANGTVGFYNFDTDSDDIPLTSDDDNSAAVAGAGFVADALIEYSLNADGEIDNVALYADGVYEAAASSQSSSNTALNRIIADGSGNRYVVTSDTVLFNLDDEELIDWADLKGEALTISGFARLFGESVNGSVYELDYAVFENNPVTEADVDDYAVFFEAYKIGSDNYVKYVDESGAVIDMKAAADYAAWEKGDIVEVVSISGGKVTLALAANVTGANVDATYNSTLGTIKIAGALWDVDADTLVFDASASGAPVVRTLSQIPKDSTVDVLVDGDYAVVISIRDK